MHGLEKSFRAVSSEVLPVLRLIKGFAMILSRLREAMFIYCLISSKHAKQSCTWSTSQALMTHSVQGGGFVN